MTKMTALVSTAALALTAFASPALAQSFSPPNSTTTLSGSLNLQQTQNINCQTTINVSINSGGSATVTSRAFSPGDPLFCGFIVQPNGAWSVSPSGATTISASVGAQSIAGTCFGTVTGTYNNTTGELSFSNATIPGDPQECVINGSLYASPVITIVP